MNKNELEGYASKGILVFAGSMLVLAMSLKFIGVDFAPLINAYSDSLVVKLKEQEKNNEYLKIQVKVLTMENQRLIELYNDRLEHVESLAHAPARKH